MSLNEALGFQMLVLHLIFDTGKAFHGRPIVGELKYAA
jgi:hypothetical protein